MTAWRREQSRSERRRPKTTRRMSLRRRRKRPPSERLQIFSHRFLCVLSTVCPAAGLLPEAWPGVAGLLLGRTHVPGLRFSESTRRLGRACGSVLVHADADEHVFV